MILSQKAVVFGVGAMGSALLKGWISSKSLSPSRVTVLDLDGAKCRRAAAALKVRAGKDPASALKGAGFVLLAVKPQQMGELLRSIGSFIPRKALVVSIAAGIPTSRIEGALPQGCPVVRVMPNTPALLGAGMAAVASGIRSKPSHLKTALSLFSAVGRAVAVQEGQMDLVTAVSGSGPAYIFHMVEAMVEAAVQGGLPPATAHLMVAQTVLGAARMVLETGKSPEELRVQVTSPGGTTQAALERMARMGFKGTVVSAIEAATQRGAQLRQGAS